MKGKLPCVLGLLRTEATKEDTEEEERERIEVGAFILHIGAFTLYPVCLYPVCLVVVRGGRRHVGHRGGTQSEPRRERPSFPSRSLSGRRSSRSYPSPRLLSAWPSFWTSGL